MKRSILFASLIFASYQVTGCGTPKDALPTHDPRKYVSGPTDQADWQQEVTGLDEQIKKLKNLRNLHLAKAARAQNQGDRLQFQKNDLLDARRYWAIAEENQQIADRIQKTVVSLEERRNQILIEHGITPPPIEEMPKGEIVPDADE